MLPPAPTLFSTTNCCPSRSPIVAPMTRATVSVGPPAENETTMRTGLDGYLSSAFAPPLPSANATTMPARMAGVRFSVSMAFLPDFMSTIARRRTRIIKRLAVLQPAGLTSDGGTLRPYAGILTTGRMPRELISTKAYGISAKAHAVDAGPSTPVCSLACCPARFLVRSLGLVRAERVRIGANRSTARGGLGGLCRRGSHGEARRGSEEGRPRRRLQLGGD